MLVAATVAWPTEAEKTARQGVRQKQSPKKPGKPLSDVQQDGSAAEDDNALRDKQNHQSSDSAPASDNSLPTACSTRSSVLLALASDTADTTIHTIATDAANVPGLPSAPAALAIPQTAVAAGTSSASPVGIGWGIWAGAGAAAFALAAVALGGGKASGSAPTPSPTLDGPVVHIQSIGLGPLINDPGKPVKLTATVLAADGKTVMGTGSVDGIGQAHFNLDYAFTNYSGAALVRVTGTADYLDEATGQSKHFDSDSLTSGPLLAAVVLSAGQPITVNINPLTTFAAIEAGVQPDGSIDSSQPFTADTLQKASTQVARLIGLTGDNAGDRLTQTIPVFADGTSTGFGADVSGSSDGVKVGIFLAIVSGLEKSQSSPTTKVTTKQVIQQLVDSFDSTTADMDAKAVAPLLLEGAGQVSILGTSVNSYVFDQLRLITIGITSDKSHLKNGDSASIRFSFSVDPGNTFDATDITVTGGTLGSLSGSGLVRTTTFTPDADNNNGSASIRVNTDSTSGADGTASNVQVGSSPSIGYDTKAPTLSITSSKTALKAGETATITFTFSEVPSGFDSSDITVTGGALGSLSGSGSVRTATFTPTANTASGSASISVAANSYTDAAGNNGGAGTTPTLS
ncbi:MAG: Ig-like domain-containing protein, partial [Rhodoferax sp.]|nr:Ig-like domain-containing protein [Rhodoferax sp.]